MPSITFIYRSTAEESEQQKKVKDRPSYFSKLVCLKSFLAAAKNLNAEKKFYFCNDTPVSSACEALMKKYGTLHELGGLGNIGSCRYVFDLAKKQSSDYIYFAEDDYLYTENAFVSMMDAFMRIKEADYLTLYDHPDRYRNLWRDGRKSSTVHVATYNHWRTVSSTCVTFGARTRTFRKDAYKFRMFTLGADRKDGLLLKALNFILTVGLLYPNWDQNWWHYVQGLPPYLFVFPKRKLFGPLPSLATHCVSAHLSPIVQWHSAAANV